MIHELDILQGLVQGACTKDDSAIAVAKELQGEVHPGDPLTKVQSVFDENNVAVVVDAGAIVGIISKIDVVEFLAQRT